MSQNKTDSIKEAFTYLDSLVTEFGNENDRHSYNRIRNLFYGLERRDAKASQKMNHLPKRLSEEQK